MSRFTKAQALAAAARLNKVARRLGEKKRWKVIKHVEYDVEQR